MTEHLCEPTPNGWRSGRLKSTVAFSKNGVWGDEPDGVDDIRCVRVADFDRSHQRISHSSPSYRKVSRADRLDRELQVGDLLLEKSGGGEKSPVGFVVLVDRPEPAVCSNFVARLVLQDGMDPRFWTYVHGAMYHLRITQRSIKQSTGIQNLDQGSYLNERVSILPRPSSGRSLTSWIGRQPRSTRSSRTTKNSSPSSSNAAQPFVLTLQLARTCLGPARSRGCSGLPSYLTNGPLSR